MGTENLDSGRIAGMCAMALMLSVSALAVRGDMLSEYVRQFNADDDERYTNAIPNTAAEAFLRENIPMFECPDKEIERTYYFRWWTYRKHLRRGGIALPARMMPFSVCKRKWTSPLARLSGQVSPPPLPPCFFNRHFIFWDKGAWREGVRKLAGCGIMSLSF